LFAVVLRSGRARRTVKRSARTVDAALEVAWSVTRHTVTQPVRRYLFPPFSLHSAYRPSCPAPHKPSAGSYKQTARSRDLLGGSVEQCRPFNRLFDFALPFHATFASTKWWIREAASSLDAGHRAYSSAGVALWEALEVRGRVEGRMSQKRRRRQGALEQEVLLPSHSDLCRCSVDCKKRLAR
jgi:hypothetical protein